MAEYKSPHSLQGEVTVEIPGDVSPGLDPRELEGRRERAIPFCGQKA